MTIDNDQKQVWKKELEPFQKRKVVQLYFDLAIELQT